MGCQGGRGGLAAGQDLRSPVALLLQVWLWLKQEAGIAVPVPMRKDKARIFW